MPNFARDLTWVKGDIIIENPSTFEAQDHLLNMGFKPTSPWYNDMRRTHSDRVMAASVDAIFE
jgi:hypothetical protein